jgi:hypothetical protein
LREVGASDGDRTHDIQLGKGSSESLTFVDLTELKPCGASKSVNEAENASKPEETNSFRIPRIDADDEEDRVRRFAFE